MSEMTVANLSILGFSVLIAAAAKLYIRHQKRAGSDTTKP